MPFKYLGVLQVLLLYCISWSYAQQESYRFEHWNVDDGLPDNIVHNIEMDKTGFLWLATHDGLTRFDGRSFKTYRHIIGEANSLSGHVIMDVKADTFGILWIAANGGGLNKYDPVNETFLSFKPREGDLKSLSHLACTKIFIDNEQGIWVGTFDGGLNYFDRATETFERFSLLKEDGVGQAELFKFNSIRDIIEDLDDYDLMWLGTNNGLASLNRKTKTLELFPLHDDIKNLEVHDIWMNESGWLWAATYGGGLIHFNTRTKTWKHYLVNENAFYKDKDFSRNKIIDISSKSENELWLATHNHGLGIFNTDSKTFQFVKADPSDPTSLMENDLYGLYKDPQDRLWIRGMEKGMSLLDPSSQVFSQVNLPNLDCGSYEVNPTGFAFDESRNLLYVTADNCQGLYVFEQQDGFYNYVYTVGTEAGVPSQLRFNDVTIDNNGVVFLAGTKWGKHSLFQLFPERRIIEAVDKTSDIHNYNINCILLDKGSLWMGMEYGGLARWNIEQQKMSYFNGAALGFDFLENKVQISDLALDQEGNVWLSTLEHGVIPV